jgi:diguanylate cyclase (GGDEF)-like protein
MKIEEDKMKSNFPVLLVEDHHIARKYLSKILRDAGYTVVAVENGRKALKVFNDRFFPIILTGWVMPGLNGLQLCREIRKQENEGYVFIVLLTGKDSKEDIITGLEAGADDYLTKPVHYAELIARLNSAMRILVMEKELKEANEKIRILSITDPLTGCYNRGHMIQKLTREIKRGRRYNHPISLIFCDLDHFKRINDTHGHQAGDLVLKEFAACIFKAIRDEVDWTTRYGGEEFLVVLPETNLQGAFQVAERIRLAISRKVIQWENQEIRLTVSFGVTGIDRSTPEHKVSPDYLIQIADQNLYRSKRGGRNRVTVTPL